MMNLFCDTILPGDSDMGMPAASQTQIGVYVKTHALEDVFARYFSLLESVAQEFHDTGFSNLTPTQRLECVERSKRKDLRLANDVIVHCLKAYYTDHEVLRRLPAGAVPPFPSGNSLGDEDDWSILEPVFNRGAIYRAVP